MSHTGTTVPAPTPVLTQSSNSDAPHIVSLHVVGSPGPGISQVAWNSQQLGPSVGLVFSGHAAVNSVEPSATGLGSDVDTIVGQAVASVVATAAATFLVSDAVVQARGHVGRASMVDPYEIVVEIRVPVTREVFRANLSTFYAQVSAGTRSLALPVTASVVRVA